ncbi:uncharacterized protein LOC123555118 [Mercenaria mercenaria]|uniref:uncharacterized protein LOC123555118 n=1 Tax=Mercenaria mercenaria TaxID=6596 RepID=UPI00234F9F9D|nr:uncharacterized protein LOC123555118 [Mercenaria mercenaria]
MLMWILLMCMVPVTAAAGDDNNNTITLIIAITAAVVGIGIIVVVVIGCMYYSKSVKIIKAKVKKQIINSKEKRNIYRPDKLSLDDYFKAYEDEEKRTFFQDDKVDITGDKVAPANITETEILENHLRETTENERQGTEENLQMFQLKELYQDEEAPELEKLDEDVYIAGQEETLDEDTITKYFSRDIKEREDNESVEEVVPLQQILIPSTDGKHKVLKNKSGSRGFLTADQTRNSRNQNKNYKRWKMLNLETKAKHGTARRNLKSLTTRHKIYGYFRKPFKTKVLKLRINKTRKNDGSKSTKTKASNVVMDKDIVYVNENFVVDKEEPTTLIADEYDKKNIPDETERRLHTIEYGSQNYEAVENRTEPKSRISADSIAHNIRKELNDGQKLQDIGFRYTTDSKTETEKTEDKAPKEKTKQIKRRYSKIIHNPVSAVRLKYIKKTYLESSHTSIKKNKVSTLRINKTSKNDKHKVTNEKVDNRVKDKNAVDINEEIVLDDEELETRVADEYNKKDKQDETESHLHDSEDETSISKSIENSKDAMQPTTADSDTHTDMQTLDTGYDKHKVTNEKVDNLVKDKNAVDINEEIVLDDEELETCAADVYNKKDKQEETESHLHDSEDETSISKSIENSKMLCNRQQLIPTLIRTCRHWTQVINKKTRVLHISVIRRQNQKRNRLKNKSFKVMK